MMVDDTSSDLEEKLDKLSPQATEALAGFCKFVDIFDLPEEKVNQILRIINDEADTGSGMNYCPNCGEKLNLGS